jgi:hypothetical protein
VEQDLDALPAGQHYIRNGWNSDPSWDWKCALQFTRMVRDSDRLMIFITKVFKEPSPEMIEALVASKAEVRVSISALDTRAQLKRRLAFISNYRAAGGIVIPILMTASYANPELTRRQERIVDWLVEGDFLAAENSLRIPATSPIASLVNRDETRSISSTGDIWSGRLCAERLSFPTTTTIPNSYSGMATGFLSRIDRAVIDSLFIDPVMTHDEVMSSKEDLRHPAQCGVAHIRAAAA